MSKAFQKIAGEERFYPCPECGTEATIYKPYVRAIWFNDHELVGYKNESGQVYLYRDSRDQIYMPEISDWADPFEPVETVNVIQEFLTSEQTHFCPFCGEMFSPDAFQEYDERVICSDCGSILKYEGEEKNPKGEPVSRFVCLNPDCRKEHLKR